MDADSEDGTVGGLASSTSTARRPSMASCSTMLTAPAAPAFPAACPAACPGRRTKREQVKEAMWRLHQKCVDRGGSVSQRTQPRRTYQAARIDLERVKKANICARIVLSPRFDLLIAILILTNTILVGVEQSYALQDLYPNEMFIVESAFLVVYFLELLLRFRAFGLLTSLKDDWVKMDMFLVVTGMMFTWVLTPSVVKGVSASLANVSVLRTARVFRLARMLRLVIKFRSLWMLMQGLLNSANTMFSVLIVLSIIVYMFACIGVDLVGGHRYLSDPEAADNEFQQIAEDHFAGLFSAMLTILSFLVFDSVRQIYWPLVLQDPVLMLYFLSVIFTVGIVLANLITAVMVNGAIEQASHNREAKLLADKAMRKDVVRETMEIFRSMDTDGSGIISREEVEQITENDAALLQSLINVRDPVELLDVLDLDDSGQIDMEEFLKVIEQVACHPGESIRFLKFEKLLNQMKTSFSSQYRMLQNSISALSDKLDQLNSQQKQQKEEKALGALRSCAAPHGKRHEVCQSSGAAITQKSKCLVKSWSEVRPDEFFMADSKGLPESTPLWASLVYQNLLEELESSTSKIICALHDDFPGMHGRRFQEAQASGATVSFERQEAKGQVFEAPPHHAVSMGSISGAFDKPTKPPILPPCRPSPEMANHICEEGGGHRRSRTRSQ
eukprot:TRINITY_DN10301_c0_g6_i1.p1 TRINITY_DN10301_c0_g6~~TRINITY_DN10301_c0_g6_i1.p1  ORF type:complete len:672 (+),score=79.13 TRINITY_DN10301_c0_g6_i1:86-2101(+)